MPGFLTTFLSSVPWPLPVRPSLDNLAAPEVRNLVAVALWEFGLAVLLLSICTVARRGRVVAAVVALTVLFLQGPSLGLLLVAATPTSYHLSPTGFTAASISAGRRVFAAHCVVCHGPAGDGAGGLGDIADLREPHVWSHPVGDLFWFVSHGVEAPDGGVVMPAFAGVLSEQARWSAIDYVHALSAGSVTRGLDFWPQRLTAPAVAVSCDALAVHDTYALRGKVVRIVLGAVPVPLSRVPPVDGIDVVTVWMPDPESEPAAGLPSGIDCVARDGAEAYAILAGSAGGQVVPARFLIDPDGVLRSVWRKQDGVQWTDPARLLEEVRTICTRPLTIDPGGEHEHHH
jgi:mono/diheme cytochrome c family protein